MLRRSSCAWATRPTTATRRRGPTTGTAPGHGCGSRKAYETACAPQIEAARQLGAARQRANERIRRKAADQKEAREWEIEKAKDKAWLKKRIIEADYPCLGIKHALASVGGDAGKCVRVKCETGGADRVASYDVCEDTVWWRDR